MLEPACGTGRFLQAVPEGVHADAYEPDIYPFVAAKMLHPAAEVKQAKFESLFYKDGNPRYHQGLAGYGQRYGLVIGNPPYRDFQSEFSPRERQETGAATYDQYFLARGIDLLEKGGLLVYVMPASFMLNGDKYNAFKEKISGKAEFLEGVRLFNGIFPNTNVLTDILVFKRI